MITAYLPFKKQTTKQIRLAPVRAHSMYACVVTDISQTVALRGLSYRIRSTRYKQNPPLWILTNNDELQCTCYAKLLCLWRCAVSSPWQRKGWDSNPRFLFSTVCSTVGQNFPAKLRNSPQRSANAGLQRYLASATLCDTVKTSAKNLSRIMSTLLCPVTTRLT